MRSKVIVWVIPALFAAALLRSLFSAGDDPVHAAQVPGAFDQPAEVDREAFEIQVAPGETDPDDYQPRSRLVRAMYDLLDGMQDGSVEGEGIDDDQRRFIRHELMQVDGELAESGGSNLRRAIIRANNPRNTFSVGSPSAQQRLRDDEIEEYHRLRSPVSDGEPAPADPAAPATPPADTTPAAPADPFNN